MSDGSYSVSDIQDYFEYIIEKHESLTTIPLICVYNYRIINRLVLKIKGRYKLVETMKLFGSTRNLIDKTKNRTESRYSWSSFSPM